MEKVTFICDMCHKGIDTKIHFFVVRHYHKVRLMSFDTNIYVIGIIQIKTRICVMTASVR